MDAIFFHDGSGLKHFLNFRCKDNPMHARRVRELSEDVYNYIFQMLDAEIDSDLSEAGRIANVCQKIFENALLSDDDRMREAVRKNMIGILCNPDTLDAREFAYLDHEEKSD